jgi:hemerythrin-like domain-containing protein
MTRQLALWHAEHVNFARLLDMLEREVMAFSQGRRPDYDLMLDILYYLRTYSDRFHHPREDVAFARMVERDPSLEVVINRLLQEHRVIAVAGEALAERLNEALDDVAIPRSVLEAAAATYLVYYRHHLDKEEGDVMRRAADILTAEDWATVAAAMPDAHDPLTGDDLAAQLKELRRRIAH